MEKTTKEILHEIAESLMFELNEGECDDLLDDFDDIIQQLKLINSIENLDKATPMVFPFAAEGVSLREDEPGKPLTTEEALSNAKIVEDQQVKIPKVVG